MKFNEPVRPAGIGRKQVAFDINRNPSAFTIVEEQGNNHTDPESVQAQNIAAFVQATAMSRAIAYSAASNAITAGYNEVWGIKKVQRWTHYISAIGDYGISNIHWEGDVQDEGYNILTSLAYVDSQDPTIIRVRKKGWYLVNVWFRQTAWSHNNSTYTLLAYPSDSADSSYPIRDLIETDNYPVLRLSSLICIPGSNYLGDPASPNDTYSDGGIQIQFTNISPGHGADTYSMTNSNVEASCQLIWLRPYENDNTYNFA